MRTLRILLFLAIVAFFSTAAMAANVNITVNDGATNTYTLGSMSVNSDGTINLNVTSTSGPCTNTPPTISVANSSLTTTVGTQVSTTYTANANDSGQTVSVSASVGTASGGTWSWTPTAAGTYTVTLMATDSGTCNNSASVVFTVTVTTSGGGGDAYNCINIGKQYPNLLNDQSIPANSIVNYCFTIDKPTVSTVMVYISSRDWYTVTHEFISNIRPITSDDAQKILDSGSQINRTGAPPWYNFSATSNERVALSQTAKQGDKYYVTVYNTGTVTSKIMVYWEAN